LIRKSSAPALQRPGAELSLYARGMTLSLVAARRLLSALPTRVADPLRPAELARVEETFGFTFNPDHRVLLSAGLPVGERWPDWRDGDPRALRKRLAAPIAGVLFDVEENDFWWPQWGPRPTHKAAAVATARRELERVPRLVPVYGHRYAPALPEPDLPVLSVVQTDVIVYGRNLADYLRREFGLPSDAEPRGDAGPRGDAEVTVGLGLDAEPEVQEEPALLGDRQPAPVRTVPFWSGLIESNQ
jgi:hypothetical protein